MVKALSKLRLDTGEQSIALIAVIGAGTMGSGIAQIIAQAGFDVMLMDRTEQDIERGIAAISSNWNRAISRGKMTESDVDQARRHLTTTSDESDLGAVDFVIEAIFEDPDAKADLFRRLGGLTPASSILASNTSSISITLLGEVADRPNNVVGMHFFNPVAVMRLVEVVRGAETSAETIDRTTQLAEALGKVPVQVNDSPGFVANRILIPMINEAVEVLRTGVASAEAIDQVMKLGAGYPMGPLELADLVGIDVCLAILEVLQQDLANDKYAPSPLLAEMVAAGNLGRKSGAGFYQYSGET